MNSYNLSTLLKLRELEKNCAERNLLTASKELEDEQKKLNLIQEQIQRKKLDRSQMQDNFYHKAQRSPSGKNEVTCLALSAQKHIFDECSLKNLLQNQLEQVKGAELRRDHANQEAIEAHQEFKSISKHHVSWQQQEKKREELNLQNSADDLNSTRFWLKNRV
jgi:hypothetical protein